MTTMPTEEPLTSDFAQGANQEALRVPLFSSSQTTWNGILVEHHQQPAWDLPEHCNPHHVIVVHQTETLVKRVLNGHRQNEQVSAGTIVVIPAEVPHQSSWDRESEVILLMLEPIQFAQIAYEALDGDRVELIPHFAKPDPLIHQVGLALKAQLATPCAGDRLYTESAVTMLSVHLLQHYSTRSPNLQDREVGLSRRKLQWVIEYINAHLAEDLSLKAIAHTAGMSQYYFCRLFKQSMGLTPYQYLIQQRVERAKQLLLQSKMSIAEVAQAVGFCDQSRLSRYLKRLTRLTPKQLQNQ